MILFVCLLYSVNWTMILFVVQGKLDDDFVCLFVQCKLDDDFVCLFVVQCKLDDDLNRLQVLQEQLSNQLKHRREMQAAIEVRTRDSHSRFATLKIQFKHVISTLAYVTRVVPIIIILMLVTIAPKTFMFGIRLNLHF